MFGLAVTRVAPALGPATRLSLVERDQGRVTSEVMAGATSSLNRLSMPNDIPSFTKPHAIIPAGEQRLGVLALRQRSGRRPHPRLAAHRGDVPAHHPGAREEIHAAPLRPSGLGKANRAAGELHVARRRGATRDRRARADELRVAGARQRGVIARLIAADDAARVRGLVMAGTKSRPSTGDVRDVREAVEVAGFATLLLTSLASGSCALVVRLRRLLHGCALRRRRVRRSVPEASVRVAACRDGHLALLRSLDFAFIDALEAVHARIKAPVLCIWGTRDPFFPIAKARAMLSELGGKASSSRSPEQSYSRTKIIPRPSWRMPAVPGARSLHGARTRGRAVALRARVYDRDVTARKRVSLAVAFLILLLACGQPSPRTYPTTFLCDRGRLAERVSGEGGVPLGRAREGGARISRALRSRANSRRERTTRGVRRRLALWQSLLRRCPADLHLRSDQNDEPTRTGARALVVRNLKRRRQRRSGILHADGALAGARARSGAIAVGRSASDG